MNIKNLYHGSSKELIGEKLNPSQGNDLDIRPENNKFAVYATNRKDLAIVMGILSCKDVIGGSINEYKNNKLNATIYGEFPKQEYIYLYTLPVQTFIQTKIDEYQFYSLESIKPIKTEKIKISNYYNLFKIGTKEEIEDWIRKYK